MRRALDEDLGPGDATAELIDAAGLASARLITREAGVLAGRAWFDTCFLLLDPDARVNWSHQDGDRIAAGAELCRIEGRARAILGAERSALNFLQLLSGTATRTREFVDAVAGHRARILDTRKTVPGMRVAQKYAVRCGGGVNHRIGLYDAVLVKENHIAAAGSLVRVVQRARQLHPALPLIVEVENLIELDQAIEAGVDRIMLDEFDLPQIRIAVARCQGRVPLEVSGGVSLETIAVLAATGVDFISVGALTKHVRALDLSLRIL